jgi:hypothetical protein
VTEQTVVTIFIQQIKRDVNSSTVRVLNYVFVHCQNTQSIHYGLERSTGVGQDDNFTKRILNLGVQHLEAASSSFIIPVPCCFEKHGACLDVSKRFVMQGGPHEWICCFTSCESDLGASGSQII